MNWFFRQSREHLLKCRNLMEECFRWAITFLQRATTEQLAVLNKHDWLAAREEIIHYQCLSGAIQGLWKKPGCEAGGEQCSQLLPDTSRQKGSRHRLPQTRPPLPTILLVQLLSACLLNTSSLIQAPQVYLWWGLTDCTDLGVVCRGHIRREAAGLFFFPREIALALSKQWSSAN